MEIYLIKQNLNGYEIYSYEYILTTDIIPDINDWIKQYRIDTDTYPPLINYSDFRFLDKDGKDMWFRQNNRGINSDLWTQYDTYYYFYDMNHDSNKWLLRELKINSILSDDNEVSESSKILLNQS